MRHGRIVTVRLFVGTGPADEPHISAGTPTEAHAALVAGHCVVVPDRDTALATVALGGASPEWQQILREYLDEQ